MAVNEQPEGMDYEDADDLPPTDEQLALTPNNTGADEPLPFDVPITGPAAPPTPVARDRSIARKEYYSISEVCDLVDLRPHVLRYWETQFSLLNPSKNRSGNRVYQRKEIKLILLVKHLLYDEKYTVEGAKQKLDQLRKGGELHVATKGALDKQMVSLLRAEMHTLTDILTPPKAG